MGYYFEKAKTTEELSPEQIIRYKNLHSLGQTYPQEIQDRLAAIKEYVGPISSGEVWSAYEELAQDTFVTWILAGEDPLKVTWSDPEDLVVTELTPTPEEQQAARERVSAFYEESHWWTDERRRIDREKYEMAKREYEAGLGFFQKIIDRFFPLYPPFDKLYK